MILQFVSPSCYAHIYSEKLVHLPHCYFVNDYKQVHIHDLLRSFPLFIHMVSGFSNSDHCARKIVIVLILYAHIKDQIMGYPRIGSSSHALISFTRWIQKYLIHGKCSLSTCSCYYFCKSGKYSFCL